MYIYVLTRYNYYDELPMNNELKLTNALVE